MVYRISVKKCCSRSSFILKPLTNFNVWASLGIGNLYKLSAIRSGKQALRAGSRCNWLSLCYNRWYLKFKDRPGGQITLLLTMCIATKPQYALVWDDPDMEEMVRENDALHNPTCDYQRKWSTQIVLQKNETCTNLEYWNIAPFDTTHFHVYSVRRSNLYLLLEPRCKTGSTLKTKLGLDIPT